MTMLWFRCSSWMKRKLLTQLLYFYVNTDSTLTSWYWQETLIEQVCHLEGHADALTLPLDLLLWLLQLIVLCVCVNMACLTHIRLHHKRHNDKEMSQDDVLKLKSTFMSSTKRTQQRATIGEMDAFKGSNMYRDTSRRFHTYTTHPHGHM